jgi:hypothetical protein
LLEQAAKSPISARTQVAFPRNPCTILITYLRNSEND